MTDFLCNDILEKIGEEKDKIDYEKYLKNHKKKFNIVIREIWNMSMTTGEEGSDLLRYRYLFKNTEHKNIFVANEGGPGSSDYTEDLILRYDSIEDCINKVNGRNDWDIILNTA